MLDSYLPILTLIIIAVGFSIGSIVLSGLIGQKKPTALKLSPYECGMPPVGSARERFSVVRHADVRGIDGAKHLWVGEKHVTRVLNEICSVVAPDRVPLPTEWNGPMERWSDL